jgi:hypothetical protein
MNLDYYHEDIIDAFLSKKLSAEEHAAVEAKMASDADYAEAVELQRNLREALKLKAIRAQMQAITSGLDAEGFYEEEPEDELDQQIGEAIKAQKVEESVKEISEELEKEGFYDQKEEAEAAPDASGGGGKVRSIFNMRYIGIAASILLVIGAFYLMAPTGANTDNLYASYFMPPQEDISEDLEMLIEGEGFATNKEELLEVKEGLKAYVKKDYNKAISVFNACLQKDYKSFNQNELRYLLAISQMAVEQPHGAIKNLTALNKIEGFDKKGGVKWYLALAYLSVDDRIKAKEYFEQVKDTEQFGPAATDLLKVEVLKNATTVIESNDRSGKEKSKNKLRFGLKDINNLSLTINKQNGKLDILNDGKEIPENIQIVEVSVDVFDGEAYSGSFLMKENEPMPVEEIMPEEVLVINLVILKDTETKETAAWERVPHQWVEGEEAVETES